MQSGSVTRVPLLKDQKSRFCSVFVTLVFCLYQTISRYLPLSVNICSGWWVVLAIDIVQARTENRKFSLERWTGGQPDYLGKSQIWFKKAIHEPSPIMQICVWKKGFITSELFAEKLLKLSVNDVEGFNMWISQSIYGSVEESYGCSSFNKYFSLTL